MNNFRINQWKNRSDKRNYKTQNQKVLVDKVQIEILFRPEKKQKESHDTGYLGNKNPDSENNIQVMNSFWIHHIIVAKDNLSWRLMFPA